MKKRITHISRKIFASLVKVIQTLILWLNGQPTSWSFHSEELFLWVNVFPYARVWQLTVRAYFQPIHITTLCIPPRWHEDYFLTFQYYICYRALWPQHSPSLTSISFSPHIKWLNPPLLVLLFMVTLQSNGFQPLAIAVAPTRTNWISLSKGGAWVAIFTCFFPS